MYELRKKLFFLLVLFVVAMVVGAVGFHPAHATETTAVETTKSSAEVVSESPAAPTVKDSIKKSSRSIASVSKESQIIQGIKAYDGKIKEAADLKTAIALLQEFKGFIKKAELESKRNREVRDVFYSDLVTYYSALNMINERDLLVGNCESSKNTLKVGYTPANREEELGDPVLVYVDKLIDVLCKKRR